MEKSHYNIASSNAARAEERSVVDTTRVGHWMSVADRLQGDLERIYEDAKAGNEIHLSNARGDKIILRPATPSPE